MSGSSGPGHSLNIRLTEAVVFLRGGVDLNSTKWHSVPNAPPALLRGLLVLRVDKPVKVKSIEVELEGTTRTEWPEGIGARRIDITEERHILSAKTVFFQASASARRGVSVGPGVTLDDEHAPRKSSETVQNRIRDTIIRLTSPTSNHASSHRHCQTRSMSKQPCHRSWRPLLHRPSYHPPWSLLATGRPTICAGVTPTAARVTSPSQTSRGQAFPPEKALDNISRFACRKSNRARAQVRATCLPMNRHQHMSSSAQRRGTAAPRPPRAPDAPPHRPLCLPRKQTLRGRPPLVGSV
ncbi:hypothetical protein EXIGLDRAFT_159254 [Exidia glandulosa HHB12029]|uniref:Arrestin-like N-terminal domain-containing protein n=1 Tax=Exidia glandulosa HHB12029 TaxID=1314781 RepID=A0A165FJL7_EXIGL|nr:hypothetical protein EXIGLDRAFT_159254 [Exidia glandulosa HHB12029]